MAVTTQDPRVQTRTAPADVLAEAELITSPSLLTRASWGAIFAGATVAAVLAIWLNLLGVAIGLAAWEPMAQQATGFGWGAALWVLGTAIVSLFCGGWVTGRLTGTPRRLDRALHGVVTWSVATLFGLFVLIMGVSNALSGTASMLGDVAGAAAPALGAAAQQAELPSGVSRELEDLVAEARNDPQLRQSVLAVISGDATEQDRQRLIEELSTRAGVDQAQIEQQLARWEQQGQELKQTVAQTAEKGATALSGATFLGVAAMFLGLCSGGLGAAVASPAGHRRREHELRQREDRRRSPRP